MRTRHLRPAAVAALLSLTACGGSGGIGHGTPREFTRTDSAVTVLPNANPGFTATQVVTLGNDDGDARDAVVSLANRVGAITGSASSSGYQIQVTLRADAPTEDDARAALATMTVVHRDSLGSATLYLDHEVVFGAYDGPATTRAATIAATLPGALSYRLYQDTNVGDVSSSGLHGTYARLRSGTGDVALSGTWDKADAAGDTGTVTVNGDVAVLAAVSDTGGVQVSVPGTRNAVALIDSSTGSIDVTVGRTLGTVFDLEGYTSVGTVAIAVAGTSATGPQTDEHGHYRSPDFSSGTPQVQILGRTSVGNVSIHE